MLLIGHVHVDGVGAGLPTYFESILIGATWTTYLSTIGFKIGKQKAQLNAGDRIEALKNEFNQQLQELKKNLIPQVKDTVEIAEKSDKVEKPTLAPGMESSMGSAIDNINTAIQSQTNLTRQMIRKDFMRI